MAAGTRGARAASSHKDNGKAVKQLRRSSNKGGISNNKTAVKQQQSRSKAAVKLEGKGTTATSSKRLSTRNVLCDQASTPSTDTSSGRGSVRFFCASAVGAASERGGARLVSTKSHTRSRIDCLYFAARRVHLLQVTAGACMWLVREDASVELLYIQHIRCG
jgi:hypothetical protein